MAQALIFLVAVFLLLPPQNRIRLSLPLGTILHAPLRSLVILRKHLQHLEEENNRLARMCAELAAENARLVGRPQTTSPLPSSRYSLICSPIINRDVTTMRRWLVVSRGRRHGVFPGAPVLALEGIVGKVVAAGEHQALVQTILDPESKISVRDIRSGIIGLCRAYRNELLFLDFIDKGADVQVNDTVITAGTGQVFPAGLAVGIVQKASDHPAELFRTIIVKPFADLSRLQEVFIFRLDLPPESLWTDPWLDNLAPSEIKVGE